MLIISGNSIISLIFLAVFSAVLVVDADCNVCQTNKAACINSTSFYMCYGNTVPYYDRLYHCPKGFDCSNLNAICVQSLASRPASCGDTSLCGQCSAHRNNLFACTSRTSFRMCYGASHPKSGIGHCPEGYVCNSNTNAICVRFLQAEDVTCDLLYPIESFSNEETTTRLGDSEGSSTKKTIPMLTAQEVCDVEQNVGVFQIPGDKQCLEYVRCFMQKGILYGRLAKCPAGTYFSGKTLQCVLKKPLYCF